MLLKKKKNAEGKKKQNQIQIDLQSISDAIKLCQYPLKYMLKLSHVVTKTQFSFIAE